MNGIKSEIPGLARLSIDRIRGSLRLIRHSVMSRDLKNSDQCKKQKNHSALLSGIDWNDFRGML